jgi:alcohol dehydrogenase YqhD (iron-dependent ADH family)
MWAGTLAHNGVCGCGRREDWTSHGLEHELSALYGVTHGAGLAVVFPAWMTFMASHRPEKVAQLGRRIFGTNSPAVNSSSNNKDAAPQIVTSSDDKKAALQTVDALRSFFKSLGLPLTLSDLGITNPDIATLTRKFHENKGLPFGPYYPLHPIDTAAIYRLMQ